MRIRLLRVVALAAIIASPFALGACAQPCDDIAGSSGAVLADDDCGEDDD